MATADSVKAKIQGLIDTSNETTGQNDTDLTSAVNHLKEGYGQGGDGEIYSGNYIFTPRTTTQTIETKNKTLLDDITIKPITITNTENTSGGTTVYIGK